MLVDFVCAFGGERIVQAAWHSSKQASALPPCPALDGTEAEPGVSLKALQAEADGKTSETDSLSETLSESKFAKLMVHATV